MINDCSFSFIGLGRSGAEVSICDYYSGRRMISLPLLERVSENTAYKLDSHQIKQIKMINHYEVG